MRLLFGFKRTEAQHAIKRDKRDLRHGAHNLIPHCSTMRRRMNRWKGGALLFVYDLIACFEIYMHMYMYMTELVLYMSYEVDMVQCILLIVKRWVHGIPAVCIVERGVGIGARCLPCGARWAYFYSWLSNVLHSISALLRTVIYSSSYFFGSYKI